MSIALAVVSHRNVIVASDGRVTRNGQLVSDTFDKTFPIPDRKILGAYTGTLCFSGMEVGKHVNEIVATECAYADSLRDMVDVLCRSLAERIKHIDTNEVAFQHREIDVLLANKDNIYSMMFRPNNSNTEICWEWNHYFPWCICGDDNAQEATKSYIEASESQIPSMQQKRLIDLARRAIQKGIDNAGPSPQNQELPSCGGEIYHRCIRIMRIPATSRRV